MTLLSLVLLVGIAGLVVSLRLVRRGELGQMAGVVEERRAWVRPAPPKPSWLTP